MTEFLLYLIKSGTCIALFYIVYKYSLSAETLFRLNRIVILTTAVLSLILPIWTLTIIKEFSPSAEQIQNGFTAGTSTNQQILQQFEPNSLLGTFQIIAISVYITGALGLIMKNLNGFVQIFKIMRDSEREKNNEINIFISNRQIIPFSWFRHIFISRDDYNSENREIIITHEKAHVKMKHNYDLLLINFIAIIQWFNPLFWLLREELISIHEYQADNYVIKNGIDAKKYQYLLIKKGTMQSFSIPVVNHLCCGNFKKRIKMMLKKKSKPNKAIKALLLFPLFAISVTLFAKTEYRQLSSDISLNASDNISSSLKSEILKFVFENIIYPNDAKEQGAQGIYHVKIKTTKGEIKSVEVMDSKTVLSIPLLGNIVVVGYLPKELYKEVDINNIENSSIKKELIRVTRLLSTIENPEWRSSNFDFAMELQFVLR